MTLLRKLPSCFSIFAMLTIIFTSVCYGDDLLKLNAAFSIWDDGRHNAFDRATSRLRDENYFRFKLFLMGKLDLNQDLGAYVKLGNEMYETLYSYNPDRHDFQWDELVIENLYVDGKNLFGLPVDVRVGRQEMRYGEGFLIADGTPSDRERTSYFNAVKTVWRITPNNSLDFVYVNDPKTDKFLPTIREGADTGASYQDHTRLLAPSDEQGVVVYSKNHLDCGVDLEPYYIYKRESTIPAVGKVAAIPTLDLHTLGSRVAYKDELWKAGGEFAYQFGSYQDGTDRTGYGGNFYIGRTLKSILWQPELETGFMYLSGDKSNTTGKNEGWDPLFSRWNWWSKFYASNITTETGSPNYWTNLQQYRASTKLNFSQNYSFVVAYNYLLANEETNIKGVNANYFSNNSKERGHLIQTTFNMKFTDNIDGYVAFEDFMPGDFYKMKANESLLYWRLNFKM